MMLFQNHKLQKLVNETFISCSKDELSPGDVFQVCYSDGAIVVSKQVISDGVVYEKVTQWKVDSLGENGSFSANPHEFEVFRKKDYFEISAEPRPKTIDLHKRNDYGHAFAILLFAVVAMVLFQFPGFFMPALGIVSACVSCALIGKFFGVRS